MTPQEMIEVIQAYKDGENIEARCISCKESYWFDVEYPEWDFSELEYRVKPKPKYWIPAEGEEYWFVDIDAKPMRTINLNDAQYKRALSIGNYYKTKEEAEKAIELLKAKERVKRRIAELNDGWEPNWDDSGEEKFCLYIGTFAEKVYYEGTLTKKYLPSWLYIKDKSLAKQLISEMEDDLKLILEE